jgi:hypothetical protein
MFAKIKFIACFFVFFLQGQCRMCFLMVFNRPGSLGSMSRVYTSGLGPGRHSELCARKIFEVWKSGKGSLGTLIHGGAPPNYKWVVFPLTIDILPLNHSEIGLICTNLAIPNWGTTLYCSFILYTSVSHENLGSDLSRSGETSSRVFFVDPWYHVGPSVMSFGL